MKLIILIPTLITMVIAWRKGFRPALIYGVLPSLILLPNYYILEVSGIPSPNFHSYLFAVVLAVLLLGKDRDLLRRHWMDGLVVLYIVLVTYAEFANKGPEDARNLLANNLLGILAPYLIGRAVARSNGMLVGTLVALIFLGAFVGIVSPYEARMGRNPFDWLRDRWTGAVPWDGATYRAGLRRVAGPFAHPICHGFFFSMTLPLLVWLRNADLSGGRRMRLFLLMGNIMGLVLALSRGPILGALFGLGLMWLGWQRDRKAAFTSAIVVVILIGLFSYETVKNYVSVSRGEATTQEQETAAYRTEMLENYLEVVRERPWLGFGKDAFPLLKGQKSIDNQYLLLALSYGLPSSICFLLLLVIPIALLGRALKTKPHDHTLGRLGWALIGIMAGAIFTQITVFSGTQTAQVLALLQGISVSLSRRLAE